MLLNLPKKKKKNSLFLVYIQLEHLIIPNFSFQLYKLLLHIPIFLNFVITIRRGLFSIISSFFKFIILIHTLKSNLLTIFSQINKK